MLHYENGHGCEYANGVTGTNNISSLFIVKFNCILTKNMPNRDYNIPAGTTLHCASFVMVLCLQIRIPIPPHTQINLFSHIFSKYALCLVGQNTCPRPAPLPPTFSLSPLLVLVLFVYTV